MMRGRGTLARMAALAALAAAAAGCDTFFRVEGTLAACATSVPIAGAKVVTTTDPGAWDGPETETTTTDSAGHFATVLNKPTSEAATVTFSEPGFVTLSRDFPMGVPEWYHADFCLDAAPP
jgi:hypothetical protein